MDAASINTTEFSDLPYNISILARCLQLLQLTTTSPLENFQDFVNLTSHNEPLSNCAEKIGKYPSATQPYLLPTWQQVLWGCVFGIMVTIAVLGNSIVIWIVLAHQRMRNVTNFFLVNLSITDLLMAIFNTIFSFVYMLSSDWPFGGPYCTIFYYIGTLSVASSVFTITAISLDRYVAIVRPLNPRISKKLTAAVIAIIWFLSCLLSLPNALYSTVRTFRYPDGTMRTVCYLRWPDGHISGKSELDYIYNIIIMLTTYVIPLSLIVVTYSWMVHILWRSKGIGEVTQAQKSAVKSKQRVARMLTVVAMLFAVCWLPYHVYFLYAHHNPDAINNPQAYVQQVYLAIYWLAMSNSMYNPIVYYWMNNRFRRYFQKALCCCKKDTRVPFHSRSRLLTALRSMRGSAFSSEWNQKSAVTVHATKHGVEAAATREDYMNGKHQSDILKKSDEEARDAISIV